MDGLGVAFEVFEGFGGGYAAAGGDLEVALLDQEGFVDILDGVPLLLDSGGQGGESHRAAGKLIDDGEQDLAVDLVKALLIHL